jgi:pimeloyl-ACP methyl ester carboxylesterase
MPAFSAADGTELAYHVHGEGSRWSACPAARCGPPLTCNGPPQVLAEFAALFPAGRFIVQPGVGHYPWLDDAGRFVPTVTAFLNDGP